MPSEAAAHAETRWRQATMVVLTVLVTLAPLAASPLWDRREEHVAADAVDTLAGRWLVTMDHDRPRFKKPPLARWLAAASVAVLGRSEFAVRLPGGLVAALIALLLYRWSGRHAGGSPAGVAPTVAVLVWCSSFFVLSEVWVASTEPLLAGCVAVAVWATARWLRNPQVGHWPWLAGAATGLGVLTKGPIALVLVTIPLVNAAMMTQPRRRWRLVLHPGFWLPATVLPLAWAAPVLAQYPEAGSMWLHEMRLKTVEEDTGTLFALKLLTMTTPWQTLALAGLALVPRDWLVRHGRPRIDTTLWWWWAVGNAIMFSAWSGAREPYYLACYPALALLAGTAAERLMQSHRRSAAWLGRVQWWGIAALAAGVAVAAVVVGGRFGLEPPTRLLLGGLGVATAATAAATDRWWIVAAPWLLLLTAVGAAVVPSAVDTRCHRAMAATVGTLPPHWGPLHYLGDEGDWQKRFLDSPSIGESFWFYLPRPPLEAGGCDGLHRLLADSGSAVLLAAVPGELELLHADGRFRWNVLAWEGPDHPYPTSLVRIAPADSAEAPAARPALPTAPAVRTASRVEDASDHRRR